MNKEDAACYKERYTDLKDKSPWDHFYEIGKKEGRLSTCASELTDI